MLTFINWAPQLRLRNFECGNTSKHGHLRQLCPQPIFRTYSFRRITKCTLETGTGTSRDKSLLADTIEQIDPNSTDRLLESLENMAFPPSNSVINEMVRHLGDSRGLSRLALVDTFGKSGVVAIPSLLNSLKHSPNPVVRRSCGKALAKIGDPSATDTLLNTLVNDEDTVTRSSAAGALAKMGAAAISPLLKLIADPSVGMTAKGYAAWAIAFMQDDKQAMSILLEELQNDNVDVRIAIVNALGSVALGDALPSMLGNSIDDWAEQSESEGVKSKALDAISLMLNDVSAEVRAEAATALSNAACIQAAPDIAKMLDDPDIEARRCAALSLMKLGDPKFIDALERVCQAEGEVDGVKNVARLAITTLRRRAEEDDNEEDSWYEDN